MRHPSIRLVTITWGAVYEIDLARFPEAEPVFAYVDDGQAGVDQLNGLVLAGSLVLNDQPEYMWLRGPRRCTLLRAALAARPGPLVSFRSQGVGEFCLELYHVRPDQSVELLLQDDWCFK